jgi:hypothetical protein
MVHYGANGALIRYSYVLAAANEFGSESTPPQGVTIPVSAPTDLTATAISAGEVDLAWVNQSPGATDVLIEMSTDSWATSTVMPHAADPSLTQLAVTGLVSDTLAPGGGQGPYSPWPSC